MKAKCLAYFAVATSSEALWSPQSTDMQEDAEYLLFQVPISKSKFVKMTGRYIVYY
jgi:hypothetical protein